MKVTDYQEYSGPFPRKRHYHVCEGCKRQHGSTGVNCYKARCARPKVWACAQHPVLTTAETPTFPTFGDVAGDRAAASAVAVAENISASLRTPLASIESAAGRLESSSPLFRDTPANPQRFTLFDAPGGDSCEVQRLQFERLDSWAESV